MSAVYHLTFSIPHSEGELTLDFSAFGLEDLSQES